MGLAGCLALQSCVGPDFQLPATPAVGAYTPERLPANNSAGGKTQHLDIANTLPAQWWELFHSQSLNSLVQRSLRDNPNVPAAQAAMRVAQANVYAEVGQLFPLASGNYSATGGQTASQVSSPLANPAGNYYTLHTAQFNVSYVPDIWGGTRRQIENLEALKENQRFANEATFLTLTSSVALGAIQEASLREQIRVTERLIKIAKDILEKVKLQKELGQAHRTGRCGPGSAGCANRGHLAAAAQGTRPKPRRADRAIRPSAGRRLAGAFRIREPEIAAQIAGEPALAHRLAAAGRARGGSQHACGERHDRGGHRQPAAAVLHQWRHWPQRHAV